MTWYPATVRQQAVSLIAAANTLAGKNVHSNRDTPLEENELPAVVIYLPTERKETKSPSGTDPRFTATLTMHIELRVDGTSVETVETRLETLVDQVQNALLTNPVFTRMFEHIGECSVEQAITAQADQHIGRALITMGMQYSDEYAPVIPNVLETVALTVDTGRPFDPTGAYNPNDPAPRTIGPDGRIEVGTTLTLPTE